MDEQKKKIISDLYFLRSILSELSKKKDNINNLFNKKKSIEEVKDTDFNFSTDEIEAKKTEIENNAKEIENCDTKVLLRQNLFQAISYVFLKIILPIIIAIGLFIWWIYSGRILVLIFDILFCIVVFFIWKFTLTFYGVYYISDEEHKKNVKKLAILKEKEKRLQNELEEMLKREEDYINCTREDMINNLNKEIEEHKNSSLEIYSHIKNQSIDERDWGHIDIIIYVLETGRAESIKEALQQADMLIRHNEIKQAINRANAAICVSIERNMSEINYLIERNMARIHDDFVSLGEDQRRTQESLNELVSAQELSNALKEKANVSSAQLAEDIRRLRELKDYEYYGHTN